MQGGWQRRHHGEVLSGAFAGGGGVGQTAVLPGPQGPLQWAGEQELAGRKTSG